MLKAIFLFLFVFSLSSFAEEKSAAAPPADQTPDVPAWIYPLAALGVNGALVSLKKVAPKVPAKYVPLIQVGTNMGAIWLANGTTSGNFGFGSGDLYGGAVASMLSFTMHNVWKNTTIGGESHPIGDPDKDKIKIHPARF